MNYWLVKSEPETYSWERLEKEGEVVWDGVRNYAARNHLRAMKKDELVLFYHSMTGKDVVGLAKVSQEHFQDPTDDTGKWSSVKLVPVKKLNRSVSLDEMKKQPALKQIKLITIGRLSVMPVTPDEFNCIMKMAGE